MRSGERDGVLNTVEEILRHNESVLRGATRIRPILLSTIFRVLVVLQL